MDSHRLHKRSTRISPDVFAAFSCASLHRRLTPIHCEMSATLAATATSGNGNGGDTRVITTAHGSWAAASRESACEPTVHPRLIAAKPADRPLVIGISGQESRITQLSENAVISESTERVAPEFNAARAILPGGES